MACLSECKVALVACVLLFSTVRFQMSPETALHCSHLLHLFGFLHCALPNVSSKRLHEKRQSHIGSICWTFLHCAFSNVSSNGLHERMHSCIGCICLTFLHCAFSNVSSNCLSEWMQSHIDCICWPLSTVGFRMSPQIACLRGCIITLVAFVGFFSTVSFGMCL